MLKPIVDVQLNRTRFELISSVAQLASSPATTEAVYTEIDTRFSAAFPNLQLQVLFFDAGEKGLRCETSFGDTTPPDEPALAPLQTTIEAIHATGHAVAVVSDDPGAPNLLIPIMIGSTVEGLFAVYHATSLDGTALAALESLANSLGTVLHVGRSRSQITQQERDMSVMSVITDSVRDLQPLEPTLQWMHERITRAFMPMTSGIALYDAEQGIVTFPSLIENGVELTTEPLPIEDPDSLVCWVIRQGEKFATSNWSEADQPVSGHLSGAAPQSILAFPMLVRGDVVGAIVVQSDRTEAFTQADYHLLEALASQVAVVVHNSRLHEDAQRRLADLATVYEASAKITEELELDAVLDNVAQATARATQSNYCIMMLWDGHERRLVVRSYSPWLSNGGPDSLVPLAVDFRQTLESAPLLDALFQNQTRAVLSVAEESAPDHLALLEQLQLAALTVNPLTWHGRRLGLLLLGDRVASSPSTQTQTRLIDTLTQQAAVAIEHARLYEQSQRNFEQLKRLQRIGVQINASVDTRDVLNAIGQAVMDLLDVSNLHIYLYNPDQEEFEFGIAKWRDGRTTPAVTHVRPDGLTARVARGGEEIVINDAINHELYKGRVSASWGVAAIAGFPLKQGDRVIGVFNVTFLQAHSFGEDELLLLKFLAEQASVAVQNARAFEEKQRQIEVMQNLLDMAQRVSELLDVSDVQQVAVDLTKEMLNTRATSIAMREEDHLTIAAASGIRDEYLGSVLNVGEGASGRAVQENRHIYVPDTYADDEFKLFDPNVRSIIAIPLSNRAAAVGTLTADSNLPNAFNDGDIRYLRIAAAQVSVAMQNAQLYQTLQQQARELQDALDTLRINFSIMDNMVKNLSHELRTPLQHLKWMVNLMESNQFGPTTDEQNTYLRLIDERVEVITRVIHDLVTLQRVNDEEALEKTPIDFGHFVEHDKLAFIREDANARNLKVEFEGPDEPCWVMGDRRRLDQVVNNLVYNAIKFSWDTSKVNLIEEQEPKTITLSVAAVDGQMHFTVRDEGIGIAPEFHHRIFERFFQVNSSNDAVYYGIGVGLALVNQIIDAHHGVIELESELHQGAAFTVKLDLIAQPEPEASA